jgi:membrane associated rhomboid family serine protease
MFRSIYDDVKEYFRSGNMVTRIILVNCIVFIVLVLLKFFTYDFPNRSDSQFFTSLTQNYLSTPGYWKTLLTHPWTLVTSMFLHLGVWHIAWNLLVLSWFGRIVGDLLGDRRILPLYILGGLCGSLVFVIVSSYYYPGNSYHLMGASAGVMAIVVAAGVTSPDYLYHLPIIGAIKLKFIVLVVIVLDLLGTMSGNSGGAFAHLGGGFLGWLFVTQLRNGKDIGAWIEKLQQWIVALFERNEVKPKSPLKVVHKNKQTITKQTLSNIDMRSEVDRILEKIKQQGFEKLTDTEKDVLFKASKNQ